MGKSSNEGPSGYPCMMQQNDLRRVHHPHDEYPITRPHRFRRAIMKLVSAVR
jgi:hypothetical protein